MIVGHQLVLACCGRGTLWDKKESLGAPVTTYFFIYKQHIRILQWTSKYPDHFPHHSSQLIPFHSSITRHIQLPPWRQLKAPSPSARKSREYELSWIEQSHVLIYIQSALITYVTAGYPTPEETPDIMLAMEAGGAGTMP